MFVKVKEKFEKTRHVKSNDKSKKWKSIFYEEREKQDIMIELHLINRHLIISPNLLHEIIHWKYYSTEKLHWPTFKPMNIFFQNLFNDILYFFLAQIFIISTCLRYIDNADFVNFLGEYQRYREDFFRENYFFKGLSNDISHFVLAQNFIFSTCLR